MACTQHPDHLDEQPEGKDINNEQPAEIRCDYLSIHLI